MAWRASGVGDMTLEEGGVGLYPTPRSSKGGIVANEAGMEEK